MSEDKLKDNVLQLINKILESISTHKKHELAVINKFYTYDEFNDLLFEKISKEKYEELRQIIEDIDIKCLTKKLNDIESMVNDYKDKCENYWECYNESYKNHLKNKLTKLSGCIDKHYIMAFGKDLPEKRLTIYNEFFKNIISIEIDKEILESFSYGNKNYVVFGKNGSGKTRLLRYIKDNYFNSNSFVIPSDKEIRFGKLDHINMDYSRRYPLANIFGESSYIYTNDILTILFKDKIVNELQKEDFTITDSMGNRNAISYDKLIKIYNGLGLDRKIYLDINTNKIMLYNDTLGVEPYYIQDGSDGEKSIVQFIMFILLCPLNSFVFIDEPESHFNTALLNELFNILEQERNDIVFIYCTHNIDFIELRTNAELIYLDNFDGKSWKMQKFNSFDDISIENIINIIGTKKNILFIESQKENLDYKIYSSLFDNFKIIPVSSCDKVIEFCKMFNGENFFNLNRIAYGIIDNDFRKESEIIKFKQSKIFTLKYNEIENMLLSPCILEFVCEKYNLNRKLKELKKEIVKLATSQKDGIIKDFINKVFPKHQKSLKLNFDGDIEVFQRTIDTINEENKKQFMDVFEDFVLELNEALDSKDYDKIVKKYPNKGFVSCLSTLGIKKEVYISWIIDLLKKDNLFKEKVKRELFDNFFE